MTPLLHRRSLRGTAAFILGLSMTMGVMAQDGGGTRLAFDLGGSARALGMGSALSAMTGEGDGFYWNPAVLAQLQRNEIQTFHTSLFFDTIYDSAAYLHPLGSAGSFGVAFARVGTDLLSLTAGNQQSLGTFSFEQLQGLAAYGFTLDGGLDLGAGVKYIRQDSGTSQGDGVGVDLGILYRFARDAKAFSKIGLDNLTVGLSMTNLLRPSPKMSLTGDSPARTLRASLAYRIDPSPNDTLWIGLEADGPDSGGVTFFRGGVEYGWNGMVFGRAGFDGVGPTAGAGFRWSGFEVNYAFNQRDLGALHRFSLTYRFGGYKDPLSAKRIELLKWVAKSFSKPGEYAPAIQAWKNVLREFPRDGEAKRALEGLLEAQRRDVDAKVKAIKIALAKGDVEAALPLISKLQAIDPDNPQAKEFLKQVDRKLLVSTNYVAGVEAYGREDYQSAVEFLGMVHEVDPKYRDVSFLYTDAQSHLQPLQGMPKELTELYAKGVDHYMAGHYQEAIGVWEQVLAKNPKNFLVQRNLEEARNKLKDGQGAKSEGARP